MDAGCVGNLPELMETATVCRSGVGEKIVQRSVEELTAEPGFVSAFLKLPERSKPFRWSNLHSILRETRSGALMLSRQLHSHATAQF